MTAEQQQIGTQKKASDKRLALLPWLVAAGAILLYLVTLNHWVTLGSLPIVSKITGWDWHPGYADWRPTFFAPLFTVLTSPFRLLPVSWQPIALNFFSALCAALTLATLARSVRLLPHDRTRDQRVRHLGEGATLTGWYAILPPILAVLVCGLQLSFWEHSIVATGEMLDALVFAYLIRCLLEFRASRKESWLSKFVLVYGLGVTNNWALIGFFPCFLTAFIWVKGKTFFNWKFIGKMLGLGLAGLSLYLLLPLIHSIGSETSFGTLLLAELKMQLRILKAIPRWIPLFLSLPTLLALFFMGIRWPSFQGDVSAIGAGLSLACFRLMHVVFFGLSVWLFLDIQYSPRVLGKEVSFLPWLSFYYMAALSVGYFSGYILLFFGTESLNPREKRRGMSKLVYQSVTILVYAALLAAPAYLLWANIPKIRTQNSPILATYASEMIKPLPEKGAVLLSDDRNQLMLLKAYLAKEHKAADYIFIETGSFSYREYIKYLQNQHPAFQKLVPEKVEIPEVVDPVGLVQLLYALNTRAAQQTYPLFYLHPSFGYYFERFYAVPHGMVFELKPFASQEELLPPALSAAVIEENQRFWNSAQTLVLLPKAAKVSEEARILGVWESRTLNTWGGELQKANRLKEANQRFTQALALCPENCMAQINKIYNEKLQQGILQPIDSKDIVRDAIQQNRSWEAVLNSYGLADEPDMQLQFGQAFASGNNLRQAYALFQRRLTLLPGDFPAQIAIAKTYVDLRLPAKAMAVVRESEAQANTPDKQAEILRVKVLAHLQQNEFSTAENLLKTAIAQRPKDEMRLNLMSDFYRMTGSISLQQNRPDEANARFKSALAYVDDYLALLKEQNRYAGREGSALLLTKAQLQLQLADYAGSISNLNEILKREPESAVGLMNRAIAELQSKKYAEAKNDYKALLKLLPEGPYSVYYGLAEIAYQEKDKPAAIKNYKLYLKYAPTNAPEYKVSSERLQGLQRGS